MTIENLIGTLSADLESVALLKNRKTEKNIYYAHVIQPCSSRPVEEGG